MNAPRYRVVALLPLACILAGGCRTTASSQYRPSDPPAYSRLWAQSTHVQRVADLRTNIEPKIFYRHYQDVARYDRSIQAIVEDVLARELARAGLRSKEMAPEAYLECDVLEFRAMVTEHEKKSADLELLLIMRFRWLVPESDQVLEENVRRLSRRRVLGSGDVVALPFDIEQVRGFGNELLNDMLPRLLERELTLNRWLASREPRATAQSP